MKPEGIHNNRSPWLRNYKNKPSARTILEVDRRLLQSGKYFFSCRAKNRIATFSERTIAFLVMAIVIAMTGYGVYIGEFIK